MSGNEPTDEEFDLFFRRMHELHPYIGKEWIKIFGILKADDGMKWLFLDVCPSPHIVSPAADIDVENDLIIVRPRKGFIGDPPPASLPKGAVYGVTWSEWSEVNVTKVPDDWVKFGLHEHLVAFPLPTTPERVEIGS